MEKNEEIIIRVAIPLNETLEIRKAILSNGKTYYMVFWEDILFPWPAQSEAEAFCLLLGCQFGANEMYRKMKMAKIKDSLQPSE